MEIPHLTIYSQSAQLVQSYNPNDNEISLIGSINIDSIVVLDQHQRSIPFSYLPQSSINDLDKNLTESVEVGKRKRNWIGKIISVEGNNVLLSTSNGLVHIRDYDYINIPINSNVESKILINSSDSFTVSYLLNNIKWECIGNIFIGSDLILVLNAKIINDTGKNIVANTTLVSGKVYQQPQYKGYMARAVMSVNSEISSESLEDYVEYNIGEIDINKIEMKMLEFIRDEFSKIYIYKTQETERVKYGYEFVTPSYIPSCSVNIYSGNDESDNKFVGSSYIKESRPNESVQILMGETSQVRCKTTVVKTNEIVIDQESDAQKYKLAWKQGSKWKLIVEDISIEITNHKLEEILLIIRHPIENRLVLEVEGPDYQLRKDGYLEWYVYINPGTSEEPFRTSLDFKLSTTGSMD